MCFWALGTDGDYKKVGDKSVWSDDFIKDSVLENVLMKTYNMIKNMYIASSSVVTRWYYHVPQ